MKFLELTFAILKPHVIKNPLFLDAIKNLILTSNFKVVRSKRHTLTLREAQLFYEDHSEKFFYNRLITFMISGPSDFYVLAREDAIKKWRELMGPTKVFKTQFEAPDSIRGKFGLSDTRNATHGSDSPESVKRESAIIFPQFDVDKWYRDEEEIFRKNQIEFIKGNFVHKVSGRLKNDLNCVELEMNKLNKTTKYLQDLHYASALTNTFGFWKILITSSRRRNSSSISIFLFLFFNVSLLTGIEFSSLIKAA